MSIPEEVSAEIRRLAVSGRETLSRDPGSGNLLRYVEGLIFPPLKDALRDISERHLPAHLIENASRQSQNEQSDSLVSVVHYTSVRTAFALLYGALPGQPDASLRIYDSEHTNDPKEGSYFFEAMNLPPQHRWASIATPSHGYVASFLKPSGIKDLSDNLDFWRLYGRDGKGCSLRVWVPAGLLREVRYGLAVDSDLKEDVLTLLEAVTPIARLSEGVRSLLRGMLWEELGGLRFLYKDEAYAGEHECRLVVPSKEVDEERVQFDYRHDSDSLRRFVEHPDLVGSKLFGQSGASITIGPAARDSEELMRSFDLMRRRAGLTRFLTIRPSQQSYRST